MEFSKKNTSGTLWYLKKWFVYYHYVFMKDELFDNDYSEIIDIFNDFIKSLNPKLKNRAEEFFYEINIRKKDFIKFSQFNRVQNITFKNPSQKRLFMTQCKKYYFMYIMNSGGQSGYKKKIKELMYQNHNYEKTHKEIITIMREKNESPERIKLQLSDFPASIRNERQIFFYYGLFHGNNKTDLSGFYKMTNIGKSILKANFHELLIIWEHQKIKMVSQSPETKIDIGNHQALSDLEYNQFKISFHPYINLLNILSKTKKITLDQYQYVISRMNNKTSLNFITKMLGKKKYIKLAKEKIESFNRKRDLRTEDFSKEFKKFTLGISSLPLDKSHNYFSFLNSGGLKVLNIKKLNFLLKNYRILTKHLDEKYSQKYNTFQRCLGDYYINQIKNGPNNLYNKSDEILYEWHKYIINFSPSIILALVYIGISLQENMLLFNIDGSILKKHFENYKHISNNHGIRSAKQFKEIMINIQKKLADDILYLIDSEELDLYDVYTEDTIDNVDLEFLESQSQTSIRSIGRKRNNNLIKAMRSYYNKNFTYAKTKLIKCDCCGEETFLTIKKNAYLEFHHIIPFSTEYGPDHYLNLVGICPNCHRKFHYASKQIREDLHKALSEYNHLKKTLYNRTVEMYKEDIIEPINLDFLKKEKIISSFEYENFMNNNI